MIAQPMPQRMSVEEWRELERTSHDVKHEYIDGRVYAMSGGSTKHSRISMNACSAIEGKLAEANKECYVYNSDVAARLSSQRYTYPDASISCNAQDEPTGKTEIQFPRVIVEVLSDPTEAYDRGKKFTYYQACSHVQEYVLIAAKYQSIEVFRRTSQSHLWTYQAYTSRDEIELTSLGISVPFALFYRNSKVPEIAEEIEGEV